MPTPCAAGYYADEVRLSTCKDCPAGFYCPLNTDYPISCPAGKSIGIDIGIDIVIDIGIDIVIDIGINIAIDIVIDIDIGIGIDMCIHKVGCRYQLWMRIRNRCVYFDAICLLIM